MMKKIVSLALTVAMLLAAGLAVAEIATEPTVFENEDYGIRFTYPAGWMVLSDEMLQMAMQLGGQVLQEDSGVSDDIMNQGLEMTIFMAMDTSGGDLNNLPMYTLQVINAPGYTMDDARREFVGADATTFQNLEAMAGADYEVEVVQPGEERTIGDNEAISMRMRIRMGSLTTEYYNTVMVQDGAMYQFSYATQDEWSDAAVETMDAMLETVEFF